MNFGFRFKHCCQVCRNIWTESYKWNFLQRQWYLRQILSEGPLTMLPSTCSLAKRSKAVHHYLCFPFIMVLRWKLINLSQQTHLIVTSIEKCYQSFHGNSWEMLAILLDSWCIFFDQSFTFSSAINTFHKIHRLARKQSWAMISIILLIIQVCDYWVLLQKDQYVWENRVSKNHHWPCNHEYQWVHIRK